MEHSLIEITQNEWSSNSVRLILTPSNYSKKYLFYVQEMGFFEAIGSYYVKRQNLRSFLVLQTINGEGILGYEGKEYRLSKGDVFFINCRKEHYYRILGNEPWVFNWVHFDGLSSAEHCESYARYNSRPVMNMEINELNGIFKDLLKINSSRKNTNEILSSLKITEMITLLTLYCQSLNSDASAHSDFIDEVVRYIEKHLHERLTLDSISKKFNMNKYSLHKLFRQYTSVPINEFIITSRVNYAKELLRFSNVSVREVSELVGIYNVSHFINLFKAREGITPLQYKLGWK